MEIAEWVAVVSVVVALVSLVVQQHFTHRQNRSDAKARLHDGTRALLLNALNDPDLLEAIGGGSEEDQKHRRYRQLWINHVEMIYRQRGLFDRAHWQGTLNDVRDFMAMPHMQGHWIKHCHSYARDFREFMDQEVYEGKAETPETGAPPDEVHSEAT